MEQNEEKIVGTNLTVVPEFSQTALGLAELKKEFAGVVYNVENNPSELKLAKQAKKKLTTLRTTLDKTKKDVKADLLERTRKIDGEYNRILGEIRSLEDPIGDQIDREENRIALEQAEALRVEQDRVDGHKATIQGWRDLPGTMIGFPSGRIKRTMGELPPADGFANFEEFAQEAEDAYEACVAKLQRLLDDAVRQDQEVEAQRQRDEDAAALRARNAQLEREAEERRLADERRERENQQEIIRKEMEAREAAQRAEGERMQAIRDEEQRVENERLERERNEAHARAVEAERIQREQAAKAEEERQASLTLRTSAMALLHRVQTEGMGHWQEAIDLGQVLATSEGDVKPTKRQAAKPAKVAR